MEDVQESVYCLTLFTLKKNKQKKSKQNHPTHVWKSVRSDKVQFKLLTMNYYHYMS